MINTNIINKPKLSLKAQTICAVISIISAVALPQIFHLMGYISGLGTALGEAFLPMHLPVILAGLLAGPYAGAISGIFAPVISFALSGMPGITMLPFMAIELCTYGSVAGLLKNVNIPAALKVLIVQISGRIIRAAAILLAVYGFGYEKINASIIYTSIIAGIFGIALQLILIPLIIYRIKTADER